MAGGRSRRGLTIVEASLVLALIGVVAAGMIALVNSYFAEGRAIEAGDRTKLVSEAAERYLEAYAPQLVLATKGGGALYVPVARTDPAGAPAPTATATLPSLQGGGFLPASYVDRNAWGQSHALLVRTVADKSRVEGVVTTYGGRKMDDRDLTRAALAVGERGGFVASAPVGASAADVTGIRGGWKTPAAIWNVGGVKPSAGHLAAAVATEEGRATTDFLYRGKVLAADGTPVLEANTMHTHLRLDSNEINDVTAVVNDRASVSGASRIAFADDGTVTAGPSLSVAGSIASGAIGAAACETEPDKCGVDVDGNATAGAAAKAGRDVVSRTTLSGGAATAGRDVVAGTQLSAAALEAKSFVDTGGGNVVDPSGRSELSDLDADKLDTDFLAYGDSIGQAAKANGTRSLGSWLHHDVYLVKKSGQMSVSRREEVYCKAGDVRISCIGARNNPLTDICDEEDCGLIGSLPKTGTGANAGRQGCETVIDPDNGIQAVVTAVCMTNVEGGQAADGYASDEDDPEPVCPSWTTGTYPDCYYKPPEATCPAWAPGTYPTCKVNTCPIWAPGSYPSCRPPAQCPPGASGTYPNCVFPVQSCPQYSTGNYPNCTRIPCPAYTTGIYPNCAPIPCAAPATGNQPNCVYPQRRIWYNWFLSRGGSAAQAPAIVSATSNDPIGCRGGPPSNWGAPPATMSIYPDGYRYTTYTYNGNGQGSVVCHSVDPPDEYQDITDISDGRFYYWARFCGTGSTFGSCPDYYR